MNTEQIPVMDEVVIHPVLNTESQKNAKMPIQKRAWMYCDRVWL